MRRFATIIGWLAAAGVVGAQTAGKPAVNLNPAGQPPAVPVLNPQGNRLDVLLQQWEQKMKTVTALKMRITRTETDQVTKSSQTYEGEAKILRPDRAALWLRTTKDQQLHEQFVFTGTYLYEYRPQSKKLYIREMAQKPGQLVEDNFLNFTLGMKATDAKQRFDLSLFKEDKDWIYILINPKSMADRQDFSKARLVLSAATFLPRQVEFESTDGKVFTKWDMPIVDASARLTAAEFAPPSVPKDCEVQRVPLMTPPPAGVVPTTPPAPTKVRPASK